MGLLSLAATPRHSHSPVPTHTNTPVTSTNQSEFLRLMVNTRYSVGGLGHYYYLLLHTYYSTLQILSEF